MSERSEQDAGSGEERPRVSTRVVGGLLAAWVVGLTLYANASFLVDDRDDFRFFPPFVAGYDANANRHLGAEYANIARSLASGRGFAEPFGAPTGPTAWMPPLYPTLLAALLETTGSEHAVVAAVVVAKGAVLVWTGLWIHGAARRSARRLRPELAVLGYAVWVTCHFDWFFQITHDIWLLLLGLGVLTRLTWGLLERGVERARALGFGAFGGLAVLTSPVLGATWGAAALFVAWRRACWKSMAASLLIAASMAMPWVLRNHAVFGEWILVKSNLAFDLYQANYASRSGVYDEPFLLRHPVWTTVRRPNSLIRTQGESAFLDQYRAKLAEAFRADPTAIARGAGRRALAATLVYTPYRPRIEGRHPPLRTAIHPLPWLGLIALLAVSRGRPDEAQSAALLVLAVFLTPYVLLAFYLRYLLPLTPLLALLFFWGADALATRRAAAPPSTASTPT